MKSFFLCQSQKPYIRQKENLSLSLLFLFYPSSKCTRFNYVLSKCNGFVPRPRENSLNNSFFLFSHFKNKRNKNNKYNNINKAHTKVNFLVQRTSEKCTMVFVDVLVKICRCLGSNAWIIINAIDTFRCHTAPLHLTPPVAFAFNFTFRNHK